MSDLLVFIAAFLSVSLPAQCQIFENDSSVKTIAFWDLNETYSYTVVLENYDVVEADTIDRILTSYTVDMLVIDSTETSYDVRWTYRDMDYELVDENPLLEALMEKLNELTGGSVVEFRTDELGAFQEVTNWEEIRDYYMVARESMKEFFGNNPDVNQFLENVMSIYLSKNSIETSSIKDVHQFLNFHGGEYRLNEPIYANMEFPSVVGGDNLDALVTVELMKIYPDDDDYSIYSIVEVNPTQLKEQTKLVLRRMLPHATEEEIQEGLDQVGELWNVIENSSIIHYWGWPTYSRETRQTGSDQKVKVETRTIEMI
ncbi:hypothetical protein GCM10009119_31620 [Algoriphagus jejuensis]|uniref:Uncharacterized protein n=1 Tax=Algoriphagus jejuensis TaxID=419934 RepID=A0ABP3YHV2_9BACT